MNNLVLDADCSNEELCITVDSVTVSGAVGTDRTTAEKLAKLCKEHGLMTIRAYHHADIEWLFDDEDYSIDHSWLVVSEDAYWYEGSLNDTNINITTEEILL